MTTVTLPAGHTLAVTADAVSSGNVYPFAERVGDTAGLSAVAASATVTLGPFATIKRYQIVPTQGALTHVIAAVDFPTLAEGDTSAAVLIATAKAEAGVIAQGYATTAQANAISGAAADAALAHVPVVGTVGDVRDFIGAGVPAATAQAALTVNPAGDDNGLIYTAVAYGEVGNDITVVYVDPAANDAALSVGVVGSAITVNLATGVAGAITSTAALVLAAIEASGPATALVTVAIMTADTGVADDGSGVVTAMAVANLAGGAGVGEAVAGIGSRYTDITNGKLYINGGTKAVPVWKIVTSA
jgi:hypothetical protein